MKVKELKEILKKINEDADVKLIIDNDSFDIGTYFSKHDNALDIYKECETQCP